MSYGGPESMRNQTEKRTREVLAALTRTCTSPGGQEYFVGSGKWGKTASAVRPDVKRGPYVGVMYPAIQISFIPKILLIN
ncbi:hypothetical protein FOCG_17814 [Fusarium oxysporum f. sp. radicis-lycopersici 26381]|nr:hypothetical protein FOCG_17814 [Fusarium oxysporum f. sp. radicis-lycopersici 26381]